MNIEELEELLTKNVVEVLPPTKFAEEEHYLSHLRNAYNDLVSQKYYSINRIEDFQQRVLSWTMQLAARFHFRFNWLNKSFAIAKTLENRITTINIVEGATQSFNFYQAQDGTFYWRLNS
jgi:hypothetical protein